MLAGLYRKYLKRHLFRKLLLAIGISLFTLFCVLGFVTYNSFYVLLSEREQELLAALTEKTRDKLHETYLQFKRENLSLYPSNPQLSGINEYFLPRNVPTPADGRRKLLESIYFSDVLKTMLKRNPASFGYVLYRLEDRATFMETRNGISYALSPGWNFSEFFSRFPKSYQFPFVGTARIFSHAEHAGIYFVSPIFELDNLNRDKVLGYFMLVLDSDAILETFNPKRTEDYRLVIRYGDSLLFDSAAPNPLFPDDARDVLTFTAATPDAPFIVQGYKKRNAVFDKLNAITARSVIVLGTVWLVSLAAIFFIQKMFVSRLHKVAQHFKKVQIDPFTGPLEIDGEDEIADLAERFNRMAEELKNYINKVYISDLQKRNAEYYALKMQINPHFLYNTLESLRMYAITRNQPFLADKLYTLGRLYRWLLKSDRDLVPLQEELRHTEHYLELLMIGKSNPVEFCVDCEPDPSKVLVLKFSFQPIIENAIKHGKLELVPEPLIRVKIEMREHLRIEIYNNGEGLSSGEYEKLKRELQSSGQLHDNHMGLKNIHKRIQSYFGNDYGLDVPPAQSGFRVVMTMPVRFDDEKTEG